VDRHPVDLSDDDAVRWLEACLWPDVPGRVERFRSAVGLPGATPSPVVQGDMVDDLSGVLTQATGPAAADGHLVVFSSWALTYVERSRRPNIATSRAAAARDGRPVTWLTAEPPSCMPGVETPEQSADRGQATVLAVRRWRHGSELASAVLGTSHPHGEWVDLRRD
jgi:hypothetical protein